MTGPKIGILTFPGSNCDHDIYTVLRDFYAARVSFLWHGNAVTEPFDMLVVPGGFSYGDYLRPGAIARFSPAMKSLVDFAKKGGPVIGICNGFQILCEAGLLPGALIRNENLKHICKTVKIISQGKNRFTRNLSPGDQFSIPISHGDGNYRISEKDADIMEENNQIVFRYGENPNGSVRSIAGVTNREQNVLGMMPHPERAVDPLTGDTDGRKILESFLTLCAAHALG